LTPVPARLDFHSMHDPPIPTADSFQNDARHARAGLAVFAGLLVAFGLASTLASGGVRGGFGAIVMDPDILINDYVERAGAGPAFVNAGLCALAGFLVLALVRVSVSGPAVAAVFTIAGFALFGKNVANIWPTMLGVFLYSLASRRPFAELVLVALFGTALAPLSSEVAFALGIPVPWNLACAVATGAAAGFILSPLASHVLDFHRGYNLYNLGFAAGFVGTVALSAFKAFGLDLSDSFQWAALGPGWILPWLALLFSSMVIAGMVVDPIWYVAYKRLLGSSGRLVSDFVRSYGLGASLVNMGLMGFVGCGFVLALGWSWNGPVVGAILTMTGFGAFGKHPLNAVPPMLGAVTMAALSGYGLSAPVSQMAGLFSSTLAPISGAYGPVAGFAAGCLHLLLAQTVGVLHGGLNLYNNGFAGGMAAGILVPVLEWLREWRHHEA